MAIIKRLVFPYKKEIKDLIPFVAESVLETNFILYPFLLVNYFLPLKLKFHPETFEITEEKKIKGLISLKKEQGDFSKIKITKLFLEKNSYDTGERLIEYVVSKYCASGANSFYITFNENLEEMANLFINTCKFRLCSSESIFKINKEKLEEFDQRGIDFCTFESFKNSQKEPACEMYNNSILPHLKTTFKKNKNSFSENATSSIFNNLHFKYLLEDKQGVCCFFDITSIDNKNYILEPTIAPSYENYFMDIIYFASRQISKRCKDWNLYIKIPHYFITSNNILSQIQNYKMDFISRNIILVRDFFKPVKEDIIENAKIIFNDLSPFYNQKT